MAMLDASRLSYGPFTREFQAAFARRHGRTRSVFTASGTCALQISLAALAEKHGYGPNDEVLVPTLTFVATSNVVIQQGLRPVFVDVDPITYNIDPNQVERHITDRTRAIVPVHLFGLPCDMAPLQDIAQRHGPQMIYGGACCQDTFFEKIRCVWCRVKKPHTFHSSIPSHPNPPALRATGSVKGVLSLDRFRREEDTGCGMDNHLLVVDAGRRSVLQGLMRPPMVIKVNVGHDARSRFPR